MLVVAPQPFFTPRGTPLSVYYRTLVLAEQGAQIDLLTYGQGVDAVLPSTRIVRVPALLGHVPVGPSWKKLFLDILMFWWTVALLIRHRYPVVHAHEEAVFWCRYLKPIFRFRLVYDMHSSLPQQLTNFGFTNSKLLIGLFRRLEDTCLRHADAVVTICPDLRDYALSNGVEPSRHVLIENSIFDDVKLKDPAPSANGAAVGASSNALPPGRPAIVYTGTFEPYQGIDVLVHAFARMLKTVPQAVLLLVGGTAEQIAGVRAKAAELRVADSVILTGTVDKRSAMRYTALADVLVSPRSNGTNTPLKIYEQLASGKPLVATRIYSHTQVLNDDVCVLVEPDAASMAEGLVEALQNKERMARLTAAAQRMYDAKYSRPIYERKIQQLLHLVS
jgi:glycosyltransferase involved in cell wall biosynthesis